jgi:hypothetical protein
MKRREFVLRSGGAALLGAIPLGAAAAVRAPLLEDPAAWIGTRFTLSDGSRLELTGVEAVARDHLSTQSRLQFRTVSGTTPREGLHALSAAWDEQSLFLQSGREGPVACINRLHRSV